MTTAQLDHLRILDAHLDRLLETAKTRTPGRWKVKEHSWQDSSIWSPSTGKTTAILSIEDDEESAEDEGLLRDANAAFIASCAGNAEAGWRSTKAAITALTHFQSVDLSPCNGGSCMVATDAEDALESFTNAFAESILTAWPLELITKHQ